MPSGLTERVLLDSLAVLDYVADNGVSTIHHLARRLDITQRNLQYLIRTIVGPCFHMPISTIGRLTFLWLDPHHINYNDEVVRLLKYAVETAVKLSREYKSATFTVVPEHLIRGDSDRRVPIYASVLLELLKPYAVTIISYNGKKARRLVLPTNLDISFEDVLSNMLQHTVRQFGECRYRHVYYKLKQIGYVGHVINRVCKRNKAVCDTLMANIAINLVGNIR